MDSETSNYVHAAAGLHSEVIGERQHEIELLEDLMNETPFVGEIGLNGSPQHRGTYPDKIELINLSDSSSSTLRTWVAWINS